jgi:pyruvate-ferredoxin/flavodoxin oxidoreductase
MTSGMQHQKLAVQTGQWLLYRFDPSRALAGENPLQLDSAAAKLPVGEYLRSENRFQLLARSDPDTARELFAQVEREAQAHRRLYESLAARNSNSPVAQAPHPPRVP